MDIPFNAPFDDLNEETLFATLRAAYNAGHLLTSDLCSLLNGPGRSTTRLYSVQWLPKPVSLNVPIGEDWHRAQYNTCPTYVKAIRQVKFVTGLSLSSAKDVIDYKIPFHLNTLAAEKFDTIFRGLGYYLKAEG